MDLNSNETVKINPLTFNSGRFKWLSDFNLFERFVQEILNIKGKWTVPRGGCKQLKTNDITIRWYAETQSDCLDGVKLNEYKELLRRISAIKPDSECNLGVEDLGLTPPQKASLKNINDFMVISNLMGVKVLELEDSWADSTIDNDLTIRSLQGSKESVSRDEERVLHNVVKRLDSLTHKFEKYRTETSVVLSELVNIHENQKSPAESDNLTQENRLLKEENKALQVELTKCKGTLTELHKKLMDAESEKSSLLTVVRLLNEDQAAVIYSNKNESSQSHQTLIAPNTKSDLQKKVEITENENHSLVTALRILQEQHNGVPGNPVGNNKTLKSGHTSIAQQLSKHVLVPEDSSSNESKPIEVEVDAAADDTQSRDSQGSEQTLTDNPIKSNEKTKQVLIIGDSMIKHIDPRKLSKKAVKKRSYPGKKADEIHDEIDNIHINNAETSHVIIHVGTNDLMTESVDLCASTILKLARKTRSKFKDSKIGISSLIHREDINVSPKIDAVNGKLRELANEEDFDYIDNSQIDGSCLNGSKLHLNAKGSAYLACNFIKFIRPKGKVARQSMGFLNPIHQLGKLLTQLATQQAVLPLHKKPRR